MRILIADQFSSSHITNLISLGFIVEYNCKLNGEALAIALSTFDPHILVVRSTKVDYTHFSAGKSLEAVIRAGSGVDTIDKTSANQNGVFVANCPGKNSIAVTELVFCLILGLDRKIVGNDNDLKQKKWNKEKYSQGKGLKGRTLGIIGFGNIGQEVAVRALAFEMNIVVCSVPEPKPSDSRIRVVTNLDPLLAESDIVTIHVPAIASTNGMVNKEFLNKMKKDATLINTSRGTVIDENDLLQHLSENPSFQCGLDVFCDEPKGKDTDFDNKLAKHPSILGTHHIGASTKQAEEAIGQEAYRMILEYKRTGIMPNCVNMDEGEKTMKLRVKYRNCPGFLESLFQTLTKFNLSVFECKSEVFEGGGTGLAQLKVGITGRQIEVETELRQLPSLLNCKWDSISN